MEDGQQYEEAETAAPAAATDAGGDGVEEGQSITPPEESGGRDGRAATPESEWLLPPALAPHSLTSDHSGAGERPAGFLARPFTPATAALIAVCCFAVAGIVYAIVLLTGADWARGTQIAAYAAFALALLALAGGVLRSSLLRRAFGGRRRLSTQGLALLLAAILAGTGAAGLLVAPGLHRTQAGVLERFGRYQAAIAEYALAGDAAPNAPNAADTARTYDEWAANLLRQKQYAAALSHYLLVTRTYPGSGAPFEQAEAGVFATYVAWIMANSAGLPYPDATAYIQSYMVSAACDADCQSTAAAILPRAAYQFGTQLIAAGQYAAAVKQLVAVKQQYPHSQYTAPSHAAAAVAYLDLGQQQLPTACGDAVKSYQTLAKQYADTSQGAQAKQALAQPQPVTGTISHVPTNPAPTIYLSRSANPLAYYFSNDFHTSVDAQSGTFSFANVPIGTYYLSAVRDASAGTLTVWWNAPDGSIVTVNVSPLCGAHLGTFPYA